jgi:hypothetical protein
VRDVCIHKLENINNWDLNNTSSPLMYVVITAEWTVLVNVCNLELYHFKVFNDGEGNWHLQYRLDIRFVVFNKPCEDGNLVLKHIVVVM